LSLVDGNGGIRSDAVPSNSTYVTYVDSSSDQPSIYATTATLAANGQTM